MIEQYTITKKKKKKKKKIKTWLKGNGDSERLRGGEDMEDKLK